MTFDLRELYQEIIIDHNRYPRNHHAMPEASCEAHGFNRLCGDKLTVYAQLEHGLIKDISFLGSGCAIAQASASLMTEAVKGKSIEEAHQLFHRFHAMLTEEGTEADFNDKLAVLAGVKAFPVRVKCATLAWHTLIAALDKDSQTVSTE